MNDQWSTLTLIQEAGTLSTFKIRLKTLFFFIKLIGMDQVTVCNQSKYAVLLICNAVSVHT